jgi:hypothetical protein
LEPTLPFGVGIQKEEGHPVAEGGGIGRRRTGGSVAAAGVCWWSGGSRCLVVAWWVGCVWMRSEGREIKKQMGPTNRGGKYRLPLQQIAI